MICVNSINVDISVNFWGYPSIASTSDGAITVYLAFSQAPSSDLTVQVIVDGEYQTIW